MQHTAATEDIFQQLRLQSTLARYYIINKSSDALPYINRKIKKRSWCGRNIYYDTTDDTLPDINVIKS